MAKNSVTDWDETAANNTDVGGTDIDEGCAPSGINNAIRTIMAQVRAFFKANVFRLRDGTDQTKLLAFDLSGLTAATTRTVTVPDANVDLGNVLLADRRNRIVNGDMRMSQENGTTSGTTNGRYPVDQWAQYFVTSAGTLTVAQVASVTPAGSPNRLRATVTVADASLAAGEYWTISQNLEGSNVADFQYGGASAKNCVLRFGFKGPAGTYAIHLGNSAANRSYIAEFTIAGGDANTDTVQTFSIAGDQTGTWLTADGVIGLTLDIVLAAGSTFQGTTGWQAGNLLGTSSTTNGMGTGSSVFELFDVGLRLDPDATGVYGQYEVGEVHPVYRSERYMCKSYDHGTALGTATTNGVISLRIPDTTAGILIGTRFPVTMAKVASVTTYDTAGTSGRVTKGGSTAAAVVRYESRKGFEGGSNDNNNGGDLTFHYAAYARLS